MLVQLLDWSSSDCLIRKSEEGSTTSAASSQVSSI